MEAPLPRIELPHHVDGGMEVLVPPVLRLVPLRARKEDILAAEGEKVGALIDAARRERIPPQRADVLPLEEVGRTIEKDLPLLLRRERAHHRVIHLPALEHLGVAEVGAGAVLGELVALDDLAELLEVDAVRRDGERLRLTAAEDGGVHEIELAVLDDRRARIAAVAVRRAARSERGGLELPLHEVLRGIVPPVHGVPRCAVGIELEEELILAERIAEAVRVVHPADGRHDVIGMTVSFVDGCETVYDVRICDVRRIGIACLLFGFHVAPGSLNMSK